MIVTGIPSGDHECWCLLVSIGDFQRIKGVMPDEELDVGPFAKNDSIYRYMIYPDDLLPDFRCYRHRPRRSRSHTVKIGFKRWRKAGEVPQPPAACPEAS